MRTWMDVDIVERLMLKARICSALRPSALRIPMRLVRRVANPLSPIVSRAAATTAPAAPVALFAASRRARRPSLVARAAVRLSFARFARLAGFAAGALSSSFAAGAFFAVAAAAALPLTTALFPALASFLLLAGLAALARVVAAASLVGALVVVSVAPGALFTPAVAAAAARLGSLLVWLTARPGMCTVCTSVGGCGVLWWWHWAVLPIAGSISTVGTTATHCDRGWRALCWCAPLCWRRRILVQDVIDGPQRVWIALCSIVAESGACRWPSSATR
jgi:hypothetical protein